MAQLNKRSMKSIILILFFGLMNFSTFVIHAQKYRHKSEAEIKSMTPTQRVDEWVNEQVYHRFDVSDRHRDLLRKYVQQDGVKALPRLIEIIDEYDPPRLPEGKGRRGERFDASWLMLGYIDDYAVRLRASEEGRRAISALERVIERMRTAGYHQKDDHGSEQHRFEFVADLLKTAKAVNSIDRAVKNTLRMQYKINLSDAELLGFSNFMAIHYSDYPSWSERDLVEDSSQLNAAGFPVRILFLKKPERYYEGYLEFKKTKR
jgi:hypothetical protein